MIPSTSQANWLRAPDDFTHHLLDLDPGCAHLLQTVCNRELKRISDAFMEENQGEILRLCADRSSVLSCAIMGDVLHSDISRFYSALVRKIRSLGVDCPRRILTPQEIVRFSHEIQVLQNTNLQRMWGRVHERITESHPDRQEVPEAGAPPQLIRPWMHAHPEMVRGMHQLSLENLNLTHLPTEIELFGGLMSFQLQSNQLGPLVQEILHRLPGLVNLSLGRNLIHTISLPPFQQLAQFSFSDNQLSELLPGTFDALPALTVLDLHNNRLRTLPAGIFNRLARLQKLLLGINRIDTLPPGVFDGLTRLESLELMNNPLSALPAGIFDPLVRLQHLALYRNQLGALDPRLFRQTTQLKMLALFSNQLTLLPPALFNGLNNLEKLMLAGNRLGTLPAGIFAGLRQLKTLSLKDNQLGTLDPRLFHDLELLQVLDLASNRLGTLDPGLLRPMTSLFSIDLQGNMLETLPPDLFDPLPRLEYLQLHGNPLMLSLNDLPEEDNIGFRETMRAFDAYECRTPLAEIFKLAAHEGDPAILRSLISALEDPIRQAIQVDDIHLLRMALKRHVKEKFDGLTDAQKEAVYAKIYLLSHPGIEAPEDHFDREWGEQHYLDNPLMLIDAMSTETTA